MDLYTICFVSDLGKELSINDLLCIKICWNLEACIRWNPEVMTYLRCSIHEIYVT